MFRRVIFNSDTIGPSHRKARFDNALKGRGLPSRVMVYAPRFLDHVASPLHVERPERLGSIVTRLQREGLFTEVTKAVPASLADLERVHRTPYLDLFRNLGEGLLDPETAGHPSTFEIASLAAGAVPHPTGAAVRDGRPTVALVPPPGHHAGPDYGGGFCYLNNVALTAAAPVADGRRAAILDYDAHHGNGARDIFAGTAYVLDHSTHGDGVFPGTGPPQDPGTGERPG